MQRQPKRIRNARLLSVLCTVACIALAIGPNWRGRYDPTLAVLTATLIAIVWYTYFSFLAVHREEASELLLNVVRQPAGREIQLILRNPTRTRRLRVRFFVEVWRNGVRQPSTSLSETMKGEPFDLEPGNEYHHGVTFAPPLGVPPFGPAVQLGEKPEALLRAAATWEDDIGASGVIAPRNWGVGVLNLSLRPVVRRSTSQEWFGVDPSVLSQAIQPATQ